MLKPPKIVRGPDSPDLLRVEVLADLLAHTAARCPDHTALIFGCRSLSYGELDAAANLLAHHLMARGVRPGHIVALWMPRGIELLVAQAAIAKAGAAWLPMDEDTPVERIAVCMEDAAAVGLLTADSKLPELAGFALPVWPYSVLSVAVDGELTRCSGLLPEHPAYVIYTSGSTGKPKGIVINQGSICHFLRSENAILGVNGDDKVYQGFSVAFDMSFEEIWISYLVGATLWIAPKSLSGDPEALPQALKAANVTVLHAVPTLLALFAEDVPSLRIINLGGEMCPDTVVERWADGNHKVFNTYGPTEATVSASLAQLQRGQPVTIGKPLPNYGLLVMGENLTAMAVGEVGELCIFGPGVASGYLGRPDLTAEKFIDNPYAVTELEQRLYRTGDLARIDEDGSIHCLGRADDQIKIRGFRVELGEIEAVLCEQAGVGTAAVVVRQQDGIDQLVAFFAPELGVTVAPSALRSGLRARLPAYMVPVRFVQIDVVPRLTSGKIDRKVLRAVDLPALVDSGESDEPQNEAETVLFATLGKLFPGQPLRLKDDFFNDLGGHSLLAARLVSALRLHAGFAHITVKDVYQGRRIGAIAEILHLNAPEAEAVAPEVAAVPLRRFVCGVAQLLALPPLVCLHILNWLAPFFTYHFFTGGEDDSRGLAVGMALLVYLLSVVLGFVVSVLGRRALSASLQPGRYPLWGVTYFRWWLADRIGDVAPVYLLSGSPLNALYLRALGAKVGRDVSIGAISVRVPSLVTLGDGVSIGSAVNLENAHVERGELVIGGIELGDEAYIGSYSVLEGNTRIAGHGRLEGLSSLAYGQSVAAGQCLRGSPAVLQDSRPAAMPPRPALSAARYVSELWAYGAGVLLVAVLFFMPVFPSFVMVDWLDDHYIVPLIGGDSLLETGLRYFLFAIPASALLIGLTACLAAAIRWLVLPRMSAGVWPVHSQHYYRKWLVNQIMDASLHVLHGVYATVYAPSWFRMLGARIGKNAEISSAMGVVPDMLTLGDEAFIADAVMLGDEEVCGGWMSVRPTVIGHRSFVGNGAYIPDGTVLPENVLIGVQSTTPGNAHLSDGQTWMGSPAMHLPARETLAGFPEALTFRPSPLRRVARGFIEGMRIVLPMAMTISMGYLIVLDVIDVENLDGYFAGFHELMIAAVLYSLASFIGVLLLKWLLLGRYRPTAQPMWTPFVWTSEAVTSIYESIAVPNFANYLRGTPLLPWALRLFGAHIGKGVYLDTTDLTEFDCVEIGDYAELNALSGPQTHLFEDRVMKVGRVKIGHRVTLRTRGTVLYDATVGDGAHLGPLTLVMKGELIPPDSAWQGSPATPWKNRIRG